MKPTCAFTKRLLQAAASSLLTISSASAASGTWNVDANGNWSTASNWAGSTIADGSGSTANFINNITADRVVTLDSARTLTSLVFGDSDTSTAGSWTLSGSTLTLAGTTPGITVNALGTGKIATISSVIDGTNGLIKNGSGSLTLNGSAVNTFTGGLTVNAGTLRLDYANLTTPTNLVDSGNALTVGGGALQIHAKASDTTNQTFNGVTVAAGGGSILSTNNSATNVTNINLGALTTSASGGSLLVGGNTSITGLTITTTTNKDAQAIYGGRMVFFNGTANTGYDWATTTSSGPNYTLSGLVSGSDYTTLPTTGGSGTVNYKMTNTTTLGGSFSVNSLKLEAPGGNLVLGTNLLTINSGGLLMTGTTSRQITMSGSGTRLTAGAGSNYDLIIHQYNSNTGNGLDIAAVIGNNGGNAVSLVKAGTGIVRLSTANTYTGKTFVNQGTLNISNNTALGSTAGNTVVASGASLYWTGGGSPTIAESITLNGIGVGGNGALRIGGGQTTTWSGQMTLGSNARIQSDGGTTVTMSGGIDTAGHTLTLASTGTSFSINTVGISGAGSIIQNNPTTVTFNAANSYTGSTTINQGTITVGASGALSGSTASLAVNNTNTGAGTNVVLNLTTGADTTVGSLSGTIATPSGGINTATINTQTGRTFTVNQTSAGTYAGVIAGAGNFTLGSGSTQTLTLTGTSTYTGATTVSAGTLLVNGSLGNTNVTVDPFASIGGTGAIGGSLTVGGTSLFEVVNISDSLAVTGSISFGSGFGIDNLTGIIWDSLSLNTPYTLISTSQTFGTGDISNFGFDNRFGVGSSGREAYFTNGSLAIVVIPEPGAALLGGIGMLMLLRRRRA